MERPESTKNSHICLQVSSVDAWAWPFRKRWKGRLGISLRGYKFNSVLRLDYITDWLAISFISNVFFTNLFFGKNNNN